MAKENVRNILLAIIFVLILIVIALFIGRFTYSYLGAQVDEILEGEGEVTATGDTIIFSKGNDLSINASTDNFYTGSGNLTDTTNPQVRLIASNKTNNASSTYTVGFRINENTFTYSTTNNTAELILTIRDENGSIVQSSSDTLSYVTVNGVSGFDITEKTGTFNVVIDHPISTTSSTTGITHTWTFTLTFVNLTNDQSINEDATLDIDVILQKDRIGQTTTLAGYVISQYTGVDGENSIYYHDADLVNGAGDNSYRYSGANPNNYVCFGSEEEICPEDNLYRIIGVFDDNVKIIKSTSYGNYPWDTSGSNTWSTSSIKSILNTNYLESLGATWQDKIVTYKWSVGGGHYQYLRDVNAQTAYNYEVGSNSSDITDTMKAGLMYVSDYYYGATNTYWTYPGYSYSEEIFDYRAAIESNWLYIGSVEWIIPCRTDTTDRVFAIDGTGFVGNTSVTASFVIRPVFYLNSNVLYVSGDGISNDPFRIS